LGFLIIAAAIAFIYGYRPFNAGETFGALTNTDVYKEHEEPEPLVAIPRNLDLKQQQESQVSEIVPKPTTKQDPQVAQRIGEAMACVNAKPARIIQARDMLNEALAMPMSQEQQALAKKQLSELADVWLFSRTVYPEDRLCSNYRVQPGDLLSTIGHQHKVPWEIIKEINKIDRPELLKAGETIKVIKGPFHARIYRSTFTMDLYLQDTFVHSFGVGLGRAGRETPTGLWIVKPGGKLISPTWTDPDTLKRYKPSDADYPLGSRWIGLEGITGEASGRIGFAIHGTDMPEQIGTAGSRGCIRLHNEDAVLLYNLLMPTYSQVEVVE
jgi:LysM repeat protein